MDLTQESILSALIVSGGKIKNSDFLAKYKEPLNCSDPAEKKQNRDLFKTFINNVAVVKEIEGTKYIVLKKRYHHLLEPRSSWSAQIDEGGGTEPEKVNQQPEGDGKQRSVQCEGEQSQKASEMVSTEDQTSSGNEPSSSDDPEQSFIELALQRSQSVNIQARKTMHFVVPLNSGTEKAPQKGPEKTTHKPYALPLRAPPVITTSWAQEERKREELKGQLNHNNPDNVRLGPVSSMLVSSTSPWVKRKSYAEGMSIPSSPQLRRHGKSAKPSDEPKYGDVFPLDATEHKWLVTSAAGHWSLVYGLLLNDTHLAQKRDFISGFTALHWAAKCGNSEMLRKIIELSRQNGTGIDVNTKSFAGYTPLHVAAIHHQEYVMVLLVNDYGANCHIRDNSGKKAHHYLHKGISAELRELLGGPKPALPEPQKNTEDGDAHKHIHTIGRLFQPQTVGYKKKPKSRISFLSIAEDVKDERDEHGTPMHRVRSDIFS